MRKLTWLVGTFTAVAAVPLLTSCGSNLATSVGSGGGTTAPAEYLAVTDALNSRVLIYNAPFTTDESASVVLGQAGLDQATNTETTQPSANTVGLPVGLAVDAGGNLYVADLNSCRVLQFRPPFSTNMNASIVFGQQTFDGLIGGSCAADAPNSGTSGVNGMSYPVSVAIDREGDLWVADANAGRVTEYVPPFSNGMAASVAIGQTSVNGILQCNGAEQTNAPSPSATASVLCQPEGIAFDAAGDLWVSDTQNGRILEFAPPFSSGMAASLEIGQPAIEAFTSTSTVCAYDSPTWFSATCVGPTSLAFDSSGTLWSVDIVHNRVLGFSPPFSNGMAASVEIGQSSFTQVNDVTPPAANTLVFDNSINEFYGALGFDQNGNMFVSDSGNSRVLVFDPPFTTGMSATTVIGQPNMTTGTSLSSVGGCIPPSATTLCEPYGVVTF